MRNLSPGHQIDALGFDAGPVGLPNFSSSSLKLVCAEFTGPVGLDGLFDLAILSCGGNGQIDDKKKVIARAYRYEGIQEHWKRPF